MEIPCGVRGLFVIIELIFDLALHNCCDSEKYFRFNAVEPEAVIQSHLDFLEHGAEIILTNTYQASVEGYIEHLKLDRGN